MPTPTLPPPTPTPLPVALSGVTWTTGIDPDTQEPQDNIERYPNDAPVIIAAVEVKNLPAGAVLTATWTIDGVDVPEATMRAGTGTALASGWATFRFTREDGHLFPLGILSVTVTTEDGSTVSGSVEITVPRG